MHKQFGLTAVLTIALAAAVAMPAVAKPKMSKEAHQFMAREESCRATVMKGMEATHDMNAMRQAFMDCMMK